jgi:hypothetical protein
MESELIKKQEDNPGFTEYCLPVGRSKSANSKIYGGEAVENSDELRSQEFPRIPSASRPEYLTIFAKGTFGRRDAVNSDENNIYIQMSKTNIDKFIYNYDYRKAFALFIMVLERLNNNEKVEFIDYYSKNLKKFVGVC